ncbi:hypothetical protein EI427_03035 [Flammeovirga pectinis]|uniref:Uncharacterized protein n=1 Tax=Flammeovirga pectinis TaxID=2494373 RepID=A0A3S9NZ52_9BACT|nr:hypothetical protein [Flammeovirga pectinis]AZQ61231.1 hypothetical protein EI427_03035 [Flammeovirga pectinis]
MNGEAIFTEYLLPFTGVLIIIALVATVIGFLVSIAMDPKAAVAVLVTIGVIGVLYFIGYSSADSAVTARELNEFGVNEVLSQKIGGVLNLTYYLFGIALVAVVFDIISRFVKSLG